MQRSTPFTALFRNEIQVSKVFRNREMKAAISPLFSSLFKSAQKGSSGPKIWVRRLGLLQVILQGLKKNIITKIV